MHTLLWWLVTEVRIGYVQQSHRQLIKESMTGRFLLSTTWTCHACYQQTHWNPARPSSRTVTRKSSTERLYVCVGDLTICKFDKIYKLQWFMMFHLTIWELGALFGGLNTTRRRDCLVGFNYSTNNFVMQII